MSWDCYYLITTFVDDIYRGSVEAEDYELEEKLSEAVENCKEASKFSNLTWRVGVGVLGRGVIFSKHIVDYTIADGKIKSVDRFSEKRG